jgi:ABC-type Fe3+-hydroxamate transport system substrate-binding protein
MKRILVSLALSVSCALLLAACGGSDTTTNNSSNATSGNKTATTTSSPATTTSTPATTTTSSPATTTASSGDKIGVPECDDFIAKYEACITGKVPEAARAQFNSTLKQWRDSWRQAAATPQGKAGLAQGCKMSAEQARASMKSFGCDF